MASSYIKCPFCGSTLQKSEMDVLYGQMGAQFIGKQTLPCPVCSRGIDRASIIYGKYDISLIKAASILRENTNAVSTKKWWQFWK